MIFKEWCLFYCFYTHIYTHTLTLSLFPHVYYTFFVVDSPWNIFLLVFVFSLSFCVEVGFTHVDAGHCHNMTFQYVIATLTVTM